MSAADRLDIPALMEEAVDTALKVFAPQLSQKERERAVEAIVGAQVSRVQGRRFPTVRAYRVHLGLKRLGRLMQERPGLSISVLARLSKMDRHTVRDQLRAPKKVR